MCVCVCVCVRERENGECMPVSVYVRVDVVVGTTLVIFDLLLV